MHMSSYLLIPTATPSPKTKFRHQFLARCFAVAPFRESTPQTIKIRAKRSFGADGNLDITSFEQFFVPTPNSSYYNYYSQIASKGPLQIVEFWATVGFWGFGNGLISSATPM